MKGGWGVVGVGALCICTGCGAPAQVGRDLIGDTGPKDGGEGAPLIEPLCLFGASPHLQNT